MGTTTTVEKTPRCPKGFIWNEEKQKCVRDPRIPPIEVELYQGPCGGFLILRAFRQRATVFGAPIGPIAHATRKDFDLLQASLKAALTSAKKQGLKKLAAAKKLAARAKAKKKAGRKYPATSRKKK